LTQLPKYCRERIYNEIPGGAVDCSNVTFTTAQKIVPGSLIVRLDGVALDPTQYTIAGNNQGFTLIVAPTDPKALNKAPGNAESLRVDYNESAATDCLTLL
jgi:hypothetical protein